MAVSTPETHWPPFMEGWSEWQKKAALIGAIATTAFLGLMTSNFLQGRSDAHHQPPPPASTDLPPQR